MRFLVAACAAFLILMCDFDPSLLRQTSTSDNPASQDDPASPLLPLAELFLASVQAIEHANARAEPAPTIETSDEAHATEQAPMSPADQFCHALREAAEASEIPVAFFARLIWQESRFRSDEVSHAGAQGVAQFMPETAAEVGLDNPFDPFKALPTSARLLRKLRDDFGNLGLAAAAYNAGSGRIQKWLARQSELPHETRDYVRIITGTKAEDWIEDADLLAIRVDLPREAPCEGIGGLSKSNDVAFVSASPAANVTAIIRKAEATQVAARFAADRVRKRLALLVRRSAPSAGATRLGKSRHTIVARGAAKGAKGRAIRVALRERSSG